MTTPIPAGWKLVPIEPTEEMLVALGGMGWMVQQKPESYAAMLAAAPSPASVAPGDAQDEQTESILWWIMRQAQEAKEPCGDDPESPAAVRNAKLASIGGAAAQALGLVRGPDYPAPAAGNALEELMWRDGEPPFPQNQEWFIAETTYGDRVVLCALPKGMSHDYKTADETYLRANLIKRWMQFPDCEYLPPAAPAAGDALDAKRYRWLREKAHQTAGRAPAAVLCDESDMFQRGEAGSESGFIHGKDLDAAIDAALAALAAQVPQQGEA